MSETHPNAFKMEAEEKRRQAANLLAEAEQLDPTSVEDTSAEDSDQEEKEEKEEKTFKAVPKAKALKTQTKK